MVVDDDLRGTLGLLSCRGEMLVPGNLKPEDLMVDKWQ